MTKLCYMGIDSFIVYVKSDDIYPDLARDITEGFGILNYEVKRPVLIGKNQKKTKKKQVVKRWIR